MGLERFASLLGDTQADRNLVYLLLAARRIERAARLLNNAVLAYQRDVAPKLAAMAPEDRKRVSEALRGLMRRTLLQGERLRRAARAAMLGVKEVGK